MPASCAIGAIVLAAGRSSRMGAWKAALDWPGDPSLIQAHARALAAVAPAGVLLAVAANRREEMAALAPVPSAEIVWIDDSDAPPFATILTALGALLERLGRLPDACWLAPVDAVPATSSLTRAMLDAAESAPDALAIRPSIHDPAVGRLRSGHPVLLRREALEALSALDPLEGRLDVYLRGLPSERQAFVPCDDPLILANLNRPEEYEAALAARLRQPNG